MNSSSAQDKPPEDRGALAETTLRRAGLAETPRPVPLSLDPMATPPGGGFSSYLHAFRRRWLSAILLGLLVGGVGAPAVWFTYRPVYTAVASFHVASTLAPILPDGAERTATAFDIYKNTQIQYVKSRWVLTAALRKPGLSDFSVFQGELDPVDWLARNVTANFPGNAEIMTISLKAENPQEAATLVNAVVDAFMKEVVDAEQERRRQRLKELDDIYSKLDNDLRAKHAVLKGLADQLGAGEKDNLTLKQQIALQQYAALRSELIATQSKKRGMQRDLKARQNEFQRAAGVEVSEMELDLAMRADPVGAGLLQRESELRQRREAVQMVYTPRAGSDYLERSGSTGDGLPRQIAQRRAELRAELKRRKQAALQATIEQIQNELAIADEQEQQLLKDVEKAGKEAETFGGGSSIDIERARAEIERIDRRLDSVANEREKLEIENRNRPRITLIHRADPPGAPDKDRKIQLAVLAGLAGFFLPFASIIWLDARSRRINSSGEVVMTTGLDVIGAVPLLRGRTFRRVLAAAPQGQRWRDEMHESIDGIAARLLHLAERDKTRVVLVSSAVSGEGKTTLATQLSLSLARTGHRTVLVDFDLRQPTLDQVFAVPLEPGVAETIRDGLDFHEALQTTDIDNLTILPAGRADRRLLSSLANGAVKGLFDRLRDEFEFVVVDGSPILPVVDARFLCQHVDGVVLSVFRDVSSVPNILAACEVLAGFGVRPLGAVVTGPAGEPVYRSHYMMSSASWQ
ncbi:MAG: AAA family ATPase [Thermoguttaceae bacterium]|jgi:capsular exopolysaccharide synthesis family protein|nr:AAA family ATPase [Thermoguttaceae bacterium]